MKKLAVFFATAMVIYLAMAAMELKVTHHISSGHKKTQRMADLGLFREGIRAKIVDSFSEFIASEPHETTIILGDSQTYGFELRPHESLGPALQRDTGIPTYNMSIIDGRYGDILNIIKVLARHNVTAGHIVFNIDPVYSSHPDDVNCLRFCKESYFPIGNISYLWELWGKDILGQHKHVKRSFRESISSLYYENLDPTALVNKLEEIINLITDLNVSRKIVIYAVPNQGDLFTLPPYNYNFNTKEVFDLALNKCRSFDNTVCLDLRASTRKEMHMDIIHLNQEGIAFLSQELSKAIQK